MASLLLSPFVRCMLKSPVEFLFYITPVIQLHMLNSAMRRINGGQEPQQSRRQRRQNRKITVVTVVLKNAPMPIAFVVFVPQVFHIRSSGLYGSFRYSGAMRPPNFFRTQEVRVGNPMVVLIDQISFAFGGLVVPKGSVHKDQKNCPNEKSEHKFAFDLGLKMTVARSANPWVISVGIIVPPC